MWNISPLGQSYTTGKRARDSTEMTNWATTMTDKWYRKTGLFYVGLGLVYYSHLPAPSWFVWDWFILLLLPCPHIFWMGLFLFYFSLLLFILGKIDFKIRIQVVSFPDKCWNNGQQVGNEQAHNLKVFSIWNIIEY